ncbi:nitroreductase family protein [bacterium]|nr:nitroreductase family protein [bacterium]MBU1024841.1 nitroreductase family protein [bacterium]
MEFFELIKKRRSIRMFTGDPVSDEHIEKILEAARIAPSAGNLQPYEFRVVRDQNILQELVQAAFGQGFIARAPVSIVFLEDAKRSENQYGNRGSQLYVHQDTAIAVSHAHLAAADLGLGSVWVGAFDPYAVARILDVRPGLMPVAILPIGYPAETPSSNPRRSMRELIPEGWKTK